jgi:hypothetical protein
LDWEQIAEETIADNVYAIIKAKQSAQAINLQFPNDPPVHWRELIPLVMAPNTQLSLQDPQVVQNQADALTKGQAPA